MKKGKKVIMNPWTVAIGSGIILTILTDIIKKEALFSTLNFLITKLWNILMMFLTIELKMWWVLVGIIALICVLLIALKVLSSKQQIKDKPKFIEYTRGRILEYEWKWRWTKYSFGKYKIDDLHPVCPQCETPLVDDFVGYGVRYKCLRCNYETNRPLPELAHVEMIITDNVRRKYFPDEE